MIKFVKIFFVSLILVTIVMQTANINAYYYNDTKSHWAKENINLATNATYASGGGNYYPDSTVTRGDFIISLAFLLDADSYIYANMGSSSFNDVAANTILCGAVNWGKSKGLVNGVSSTEFAPSQKLTREDICTLIYRACSKFSFTLPFSNSTVTFSNYGNISAYARSAVARLYQSGIISGYPDGTFRPKQAITKAEMCTIECNLINRSIGRIKQNSEKTGTLTCGFNDVGWVVFNYTVNYKEYGLATADNKVQYYYRTVDQTTSASRSVGAQAGVIYQVAAYYDGSNIYKKMVMAHNQNVPTSGQYFAAQHLEDHTHITLVKNNSMTAQTAYSVVGTSDSILAPRSQVFKFSLSY